MLEHYASQASGLLGLGASVGPRMLAVVSHGDEQAELPLLWQLCLALVNLGYTVTVLDGTTQESDANPGLIEQLDQSNWNATRSHRDAPAWSVLPAGKGLQELGSLPYPAQQNLHRLGQALPVDGVIVLYCKVEWMIPLISQSGLEPLIAVSQGRTSLLTSYLALKRLLITGKVRPTIVNMIQDPTSVSLPVEPSISASLSECAKRFLNHDARTLEIADQTGDATQNDDIQRLAMRQMESAIVLVGTGMASMSMASGTPHVGHLDQFAGSH